MRSSPIVAGWFITRATTLVALFLVSFSAFGKDKDGGVDTSGGGDTRSLQFVMMAKELIKYLEPMEKNEKIDLGKIDYAALRKAIETTRVSVTNDPIYVNGIPKEAKNYPRRNPPEIVVNAERWDAVNESSKRAAIVLHEYLGILGVDDTGYQISSRIYSDHTLRLFLNNADFAAAPDAGYSLPFAVTCKLYHKGKLVPDALGRIGESGSIGGKHYDAQMFSGRRVKETPDGPLMVTVDTGMDPVTQFQETFKTDVKRPIIRVSIGYGDQFVGPPKSVVVENDLRVTPDFDATVAYPKEQIRVRCKRLTRQDLVDDMNQFKLESMVLQCGVHPDEVRELLPHQIRRIMEEITQKAKAIRR